MTVVPGDMLSRGTGGEWVTQAGETIYPGVNTTTFGGILIMTCAIERDTQDTPDESGKLAPPIWTQIGSSISCLAESHSIKDRQFQEIDTAKTVIEGINLMLASDIDVLINDRITNIVRKSDDSVFDAGPLYIDEINPVDDFVGGGIHHIECLLKRRGDQ